VEHPFARGQVVYLQIPASDPEVSARFYEAVFGWKIDPPETGFEAPGMIGQWVTDRPASPAGGILVWITVDDVAASLEFAGRSGGRALEQPYDDGPERILATIADPAGNTIGIVEHR
jgi:predicted enzyme related to lactoylglutathione lyase